MKKLLFSIFFLYLNIVSISLFAQEDSISRELNKSIRVLSEPVVQLSDVVRLNERPQTHDTLTIPVDIRYVIHTKPVATTYEIKTLKAVNVTGDKLQELYRGQLSLGFGNYAKSFANLRFMSERSRRQQAGIDIYHYASAGKVKLESNQKVPAGYSTNYISAHGKLFKDKIVLSGSITPHLETVHMYGIETDSLIAPNNEIYDTTIAKKDSQRRIFSLTTQGMISSRDTKAEQYKHMQKILHDFTLVTPKLYENHIALSSEGSKKLEKMTVGYTSNFRWSSINFNPLDSVCSQNFSQLTLLPFIATSLENWNLHAGIKLSNVWGVKQFKAYPDIIFSYNYNNHALVPYLQYKGNLETYSLKDMYAENPYCIDSLMLQPTNFASIFKFGIQGKIAQNIPFNTFIGFSKAENMHFWINDALFTDTAQNKFNVVYDNTSIFTTGFETGIQQKAFSMNLRFQYSNYSLDSLQRAWHKPGLEGKYSIRYNIIHPRTNKNKLILRADVFYEDMRYAQQAFTQNEIKLAPLFDCNLGVEYYYSSVLIAFLDFNNLTATRYERFYQYPVQRFQIMFGITYSFSGLRK
ncbi:MAG: hypothetical protein M0R02_07400 [Bacteroidales bacterium]|nr:hypothetical protein [Bacteroidales bacterium]NLK80632.1 hypothetical protein [Bacteroidales bacterium]